MTKKIVDMMGRECSKEDLFARVGKGWRSILDRLIDDLFALGWDGEVHQVKEKFGALRFYIGAGSQKIYRRIDRAERKSGRTCENCGKPGKVGGSGWYLALCDGCRKGVKG